jgi:hypothetical protein
MVAVLYAWIVLKMVIMKVIKSSLKRLMVAAVIVGILRLGNQRDSAKIIPEKQSK